MFNLQGSELVIILLLALVVLGPEKLPEAMRRLGRFYGDVKRMSTSFQKEFKAAVDEPVRELRDTANTIRDSVDFRRFSDGDRPEKPKSAEPGAARPGAAATSATTATAAAAAAAVVATTSTDPHGLAPADPDAVATDAVPFGPDHDVPDPDDAPADGGTAPVPVDTAHDPAPGLDTPEVAEPEPEPVAVEPDPVAVEPDPVAVEPEPVAVEPEPVAVEPEPVAVEPEPIPEAVVPDTVDVGSDESARSVPGVAANLTEGGAA